MAGSGQFIIEDTAGGRHQGSVEVVDLPWVQGPLAPAILYPLWAALIAATLFAKISTQKSWFRLFAAGPGFKCVAHMLGSRSSAGF